MAPFTHAFQKLSLIGKRKDDKSDTPKSGNLPSTRSATTATCDRLQLTKNISVDRLAKCPDKSGPAVIKPAVKYDPLQGPCTKKSTAGDAGGGGGGRCPVTCGGFGAASPECESINTFLRPDNLLMGDAHVKMDQARPYLVGNKLMREIPLRDTSKILNDKELRSLHWVIGESVERHAERTARYFANLFRSKELTDVIIYSAVQQAVHHRTPEKMLMPEVCVDVSQLQTRALLRCVEFMYKGSTEVHHFNAAEVLNVAQSLKIFSLAQICKDKLKSLQFSDLLPQPPKDRQEAALGLLARARIDEETKQKRLKGVTSDESIEPPPCEPQEKTQEDNDKDMCRQDEVKAMADDPIDFYKITGASTFQAWPIETVEALFNNNDIRINSELDIVEAMIKWIQFRPEQRKMFAERLLDCVRFVHTTAHEMLDCKHLIPELFDLGPLRTRMAKAKWTKDLIERGVVVTDVIIPACRVNRQGYWAETDPCENPVDNIYGDELPVEGVQPFSAGTIRPQEGKAARSMVSKKCRKMLCDQIQFEDRTCPMRN
ncbi:hypothetical protein BV898_13442 [Hypsibius exemplaris]|uniref:BACK domain-containing protein n=1 Tax=Hypsibius exemplaris TaxID=2072580 RepID=A0A1W0WB01_HYPEX|nr:hypothetical protein BV898_13442 [Hypsibius exemplaris]